MVRRRLPVSSPERSKNGRWLVCLKSGRAKVIYKAKKEKYR